MIPIATYYNWLVVQVSVHLAGGRDMRAFLESGSQIGSADAKRLLLLLPRWSCQKRLPMFSNKRSAHPEKLLFNVNVDCLAWLLLRPSSQSSIRHYLVQTKVSKLIILDLQQFYVHSFQKKTAAVEDIFDPHSDCDIGKKEVLFIFQFCTMLNQTKWLNWCHKIAADADAKTNCLRFPTKDQLIPKTWMFLCGSSQSTIRHYLVQTKRHKIIILDHEQFHDLSF